MSEWQVTVPVRATHGGGVPTGFWRARIVVLEASGAAATSRYKTCTHDHQHADTAMTCARRWAAELNAAAAANLTEFQVTFGSQYSPRNQRHPVWPLAHRDGWVTIAAPDAEAARAIAVERLGVYWSMMYGPEDARVGAGWVTSDFDPTYFPLGELAHATYVDEATPVLWDQSAGERIWEAIDAAGAVAP